VQFGQVAHHGVDVAALFVAAARARGITVCGTASRTAATSHLAMTLILAATRNLLPNVKAIEGGGWQAEAGRDLEGLTLGLIGLGRLGAAMAALVASTLGLAMGPVWHSDRTPIVAFGHWLAVLCGSLGKMGQDICLMAQQGVDEVTLRGGGQSSAMAGKNNPVAAEAMVAIARFVAGQQAVLLQAMIHEQERSGAAWALEWLTLPAMAEATGASLSHAGRCLKSIGSIGAS
jgi:hypothetical protein